MRVGMRSAAMTFGPMRDGVPTTSRLSLSGITLPAASVSEVPGLGSLAAYGYGDLDLDATVVGSYIDDAIDLVASALGRRPRTVVDIGAGTGTGTDRLAAHLDDAGDLVARRDPAVQFQAAPHRQGARCDQLTRVQIL